MSQTVAFIVRKIVLSVTYRCMRRVDETFRRPGHSAAVFSGAQLHVFNRGAEPEATRALFLRFQVFKLGRAAPHAPATPSDDFREGQPPVRSTRGIISPCFPQQPLIQPTTYSPHSSAAAPVEPAGR